MFESLFELFKLAGFKLFALHFPTAPLPPPAFLTLVSLATIELKGENYIVEIFKILEAI